MKLRLLGLMGSSLLVVALAGCGTPGAPSLPSLNLARPVEDLTASRRGNKVDLDWTQPRKNTDRTNVKHNPTTLICRHEGTTLMDKCEVVAEVAPPSAKAPQKQKGEGPPGDVRIHYVDTLPTQLGLKDPDGLRDLRGRRDERPRAQRRTVESSGDSGSADHRRARQSGGRRQSRRRTRHLDGTSSRLLPRRA